MTGKIRRHESQLNNRNRGILNIYSFTYVMALLMTFSFHHPTNSFTIQHNFNRNLHPLLPKARRNNSKQQPSSSHQRNLVIINNNSAKPSNPDDDNNDETSNERNNEQQQEYEFTKDLQNAKQKLGTSIRTEETEINAENAQNAFLDAMKSVKQTFDQSKEEVGVDQAIDLIKSQWDRDEDEEESDENLDPQGEFE